MPSAIRRKAIKIIKTYTEQASVASVTNAIANEIARAQCVVFLGFAFHSQNMRLLQPPEKIRSKPIFGTAYGQSDADLDVVTHNVANFFHPPLASAQRRLLIKFENKLKVRRIV